MTTTYTKTRQGEWVAVAPVHELPAMRDDHKARANGPWITVELRSGATEDRQVEKYGKVFDKAGVPTRYAYLAPRDLDAQAANPNARLAAAHNVAPLPDVPEGHYATASATGNNDLDFWRVDRPADGRWAGRVFVKRMIGGRPDVPVRGAQARAALQAILDAGVDAAGARYGQEIGRCRYCNRSLTDQASRDAGVGPDCAAEHGVAYGSPAAPAVPVVDRDALLAELVAQMG